MLDQHVRGLQYRRRRFLLAVRRRRQPGYAQVGLARVERRRDLIRRHDQIFDADTEFQGKGLDQVVFQSEDGALVVGVIGQRTAADGDNQVMLSRLSERVAAVFNGNDTPCSPQAAKSIENSPISRVLNQCIPIFVLLCCPLRRGGRVVECT